MRIIAFPFHDWRKCQREGFRTRDGHLMEHIDANDRVERLLVIDRPVSFAERLFRRASPYATGSVEAESSMGQCHGRLTRVTPKTSVLDIVTPDILVPLRRRRGWWFDVFEKPDVLDLIRWAADVTGTRDGSVVAWVPTVAPALAALAPRSFVFDSLDNWLIHPALRKYSAEAAAAYAMLLPAASAVFVSAPASRAVLSPWRPSIEVLGNGVDPSFFAHASPRPPDLPGGPLVGYVGKLAERIDNELVRDVARSLRAVAFVFVGPILSQKAVRPMRGLPNVFLLGERAYRQIPAYVHAFDLTWIPHRVGEGETGGDPIKLYEYWAAGKQVVATPIDGIASDANQLHLGTNAAELSVLIQGLLSGAIKPKPVGVPSNRTWCSIADRLLDSLEVPRQCGRSYA